MKTPRSLVYMAHATIAFLLAAAVVVGGMWGLMEMVKPREGDTSHIKLQREAKYRAIMSIRGRE